MTNEIITSPINEKAVENVRIVQNEICNVSVEDQSHSISKNIDDPTPVFPQSMYSRLPDVLKVACSNFTDLRERDVFLIGSLVLLSGCFEKVYGYYDSKLIRSNLYGFVVAPAASGKGVLSYSKLLVSQIEADSSLEKNDQAAAFASLKKLLGSKTALNPPAHPPLFIPGNISEAALYQHLAEAGGTGIFFETEGDVIANANRSIWGNYSTILRKAFHHEPISYRRKTKDEKIDIPAPRISALLSGTPSQVRNLFRSHEDGLFSRFIFYTYNPANRWKYITSKGERNQFDSLSKMADRISEIHRRAWNSPTEFSFSDVQCREFNERFETMSNKILLLEDASSIVRRLGLITFRIAMILTALEKYSGNERSTKIVCYNNYFDTAMQMAEILLEHSLYVFGSMAPSKIKLSQGKTDMFNALPDGVAFSRVDAQQLCVSFLSASAIDKYLSQLTEIGLLLKTKHGLYTKA